MAKTSLICIFMCFFIFLYYNWLLYFPVNKNIFSFGREKSRKSPPHVFSKCILKTGESMHMRYARLTDYVPIRPLSLFVYIRVSTPWFLYTLRLHCSPGYLYCSSECLEMCCDLQGVSLFSQSGCLYCLSSCINRLFGSATIFTDVRLLSGYPNCLPEYLDSL